MDGGWGVDALIGRETRIHNDIDLFVEKKDFGKAISVITWKGYREVVMDYTTDSHTVWKDYNGRIIDLHSFEYVEDGILYEGYTFPSDTFSSKGNIGNIEVSCINPEAQVQFHLGYEKQERPHLSRKEHNLHKLRSYRRRRHLVGRNRISCNWQAR